MTGQPTIWLAINDFLTVTVDRLHHESSWPKTSRFNWQTTNTVAT